MRTITWPHTDIVLWRIYASLEEIEGHDGRDGSIPLFDPVNLTRQIIWESSMTYLVINNNSYSNNNKTATTKTAATATTIDEQPIALLMLKWGFPVVYREPPLESS